MATVLPDEILVKIISESIDPYCMQARYDTKSQSSEWEQFKDMKTALKGRPRAPTLLLVNKMFYHEVKRMIYRKFDGYLHCRDSVGLEFCIRELLEDKVKWPSQSVTKLEFSSLTVISEATLLTLRERLPRLKVVILHWSQWAATSRTPNFQTLMHGCLDPWILTTVVDRVESKDSGNLKLKKALEILDKQGIQLVVEAAVHLAPSMEQYEKSPFGQFLCLRIVVTNGTTNGIGTSARITKRALVKGQPRDIIELEKYEELSKNF